MANKITHKRADQIREAFVLGTSNIKSIEASCRGSTIYMTVDRFLVGITEYIIEGNMKKFTLKRKVVRYETVEIEAGSFEEAVAQLHIYTVEAPSNDEFVEGFGTVEYTGEVE